MMRDRPTHALGAALCCALALAPLTGCGSSKPTPPPPSGSSSGGELGPAGRAPVREGRAVVAGDRRVVLVHLPDREKIDVVYWHDGAYDPAAMAAINHLMRDHNTGEEHAIAPELIDFMAGLIARVGLPSSTEVDITSGYRSPATNAALAKVNHNAARESYHMRGEAADIHIPALPGKAIAEIAKTMQWGGAAFYDGSGHTHVDTGPVRTWATGSKAKSR